MANGAVPMPELSRLGSHSIFICRTAANDIRLTNSSNRASFASLILRGRNAGAATALMDTPTGFPQP